MQNTIHSVHTAHEKPHFHLQIFVPGEVIDSENMAMDKTSYNAVSLLERLGYHLEIHPASETNPLRFTVGSKRYVGISGVIEYLRSENSRLSACQLNQILRREIRDADYHKPSESRQRYLAKVKRG